MRNATLMAIAPNANIGLLAGTTPGIDPRFAQVFSRNKISGKYLDLNHNLVNDLEEHGHLGKSSRDQIITEQGDIANIDGIPQHIKDIYKTSFSTSPYAFIEVAARAQKWVDQALSRNMYLETRDIGETMEIYSTAWRKGVKSTYYLHMKPRHTAEQSTTHVNKAEKMGKRGFADVIEDEPRVTVESVISQPAEPVAVETIASFVEPVAIKEEPAAQKPVSPVVTPTSAPAGRGAFAAVVDDITPAVTPVRESAEPAPHVHTHEHTHTHAVATESIAPAETPMGFTASSQPQPTAKKQYKILPPSDPSEDTVCDSCQ